MADNKVTHYSSSLSLLVGVSEGQGECGQSGRITTYEGYISCPACKAIYKQENSPENVARVRTELRNHTQRR